MTDATTPDPTTNKHRPTKDRLIRAAANLFRNRGYHGVGLNELLAEAARVSSSSRVAKLKGLGVLELEVVTPALEVLLAAAEGCWLNKAFKLFCSC